MKTIRYSQKANAALAKMPARDADKIESKLEQFAIDPQSLAGQVKQLKGDTALRLRVAEYRVIFDDDGLVLDILAIGHRKDIYR